MEEKIKTPRGTFCGQSTIKDIGVCAIHILKGQFTITKNNSFMGYVKESLLRKVGIYCPVTNKRMYGKQGYVGSPKKS